ncbi:MAG TPA: NAD(P)-dependent oxidoreductase [Bryobacteraceae bacterium]|nr:NAD(P)-dependent oxidoreductase [Bryobacteraceae bacterium]
MRVLITGANGCIGTWIVKRLLDRKIDVLTYDLDPNPARLKQLISEGELRKVRSDTGRIEDTERVKALVKDEGITHIVHLAAVLMPFCQQNPVTGGLVNVIGTLNVFEAARDAGRPVRIVYASSSAVWGPIESYEPRALNEDDPPLPVTHYGVFKQANEGNARAFYAANGISSVGLRPWAVYGFGRDLGLTSDPTIAIKSVALGKPFQIRISGPMDMQYVEDVAEIFIGCLLSDKEGAHVFNLAGHVIRMEDFAVLLEQIRPGAAKLITVKGQPVPVSSRMDASRLEAYLSGMPSTPLEEGIRQTFEIYQRLGA